MFTSALLVSTIAAPLVGRLGDRFGKSQTLVRVLLLMSAGTLACALAPSLPVLLVGRGLQGAGGAVYPLAFGIIREEMDVDRVGHAVGAIGSTFGIGGGLGLVLAGLVVDRSDVAWLFWVSLGFALASAGLAQLLLTKSPKLADAAIDYAGAALLAGGLGAILLAMTFITTYGWLSAPVIVLFVAGSAALVAFGFVETHQPDPLLDMRVMRLRAVWTSNLVSVIAGFGTLGSMLLVPQLVEIPRAAGYGLGMSVTQAGLFLLPSMVTMGIGGPAAAALGARFGSRTPLLIGIAVTSLAFGQLALLHDQPWMFYLHSLVFGGGLGLFWAGMVTSVVEVVPHDQTAAATGINSVTRWIGGALYAQVAASILAASAGRNGIPTEHAFVVAFVVSALSLAISFVAALAIPRFAAPSPHMAVAWQGVPLNRGD